MLQDFRKSLQGTAAKVIVGVIICTFALFGVESIVGGFGGEPNVAIVNGEDIPESNFLRAIENRRQQILAQMGDKADPDLINEDLLRSSVLEGMIQDQVLAQDAGNKGLFVSEGDVDAYIRNIEQFKVEGVFSNDRMQALLRNSGLTLQAYKDSLRSQFVLSQPRTALMASAFVLDNERDEIVELDRQERTFGAVSIFKNDYLDSVSVSDEDVAEYYKNNKTNYKNPENVDASYVEISKADLASKVEIKEEDTRALYEAEKSQYVGEEERQASHILVKIDDDTSEEQALAKIKEISDQLDSDANFAELAKEFSQDEGSAELGGDLGFSARGVYVSDFENAVFSLSVEEVSKPVKTEFGYHLIKLTGIKANNIPEFEEMRAALETRLVNQQTDSLYAELTERLADLSYSSSDLEEPADELDITIKTIAGVSVDTQDRLFSNVKVQKALFSDDIRKDGNNSDVIEVGDGRSIVFRVEAYHEAAILPLDNVKEKIRAVLLADKTANFAESVGQAFIARVLSGEVAEEVSKDMSLDWKNHTSIKRDNIMIAPDVVSKVFSLKKSQNVKDNVAGISVLDGDYSVVILTDIAEGSSESISSLEKHSISKLLSDGFGANDYGSYQDTMVEKAEVERI